MILISWRSTLVAVAGSITRMTASTLIGASRLEYCDTTLEQRDVVALLSNVSRSSSCTGWLMPVSTSTPLSTAFWKDSEMMVGWMPARHSSQSTFNLCIYWAYWTVTAQNTAFIKLWSVPLCSSLLQESSSAPAITTTEVVPSPASMSWALDSSTSWRHKCERN